MARASITLDVHVSPWLRDVLFAAAALLREVEEEDVLVSGQIRDRASELRGVIEDRRVGR